MVPRDQPVMVLLDVRAQWHRINSTAAGWGHLGSVLTQIFMLLVQFNPGTNPGVEADTAWQVTMIEPAVLLLIVAAAMRPLAWMFDVP